MLRESAGEGWMATKTAKGSGTAMLTDPMGREIDNTLHEEGDG